MRFFSQFPKVDYAFDEFQPTVNTKIIDLYRYVDVNRDITNDLSSYLTYSIGDGERPDQVSQKLYGTPDYHWTFFIINELLKNGIDNWPKSYTEMDNYLQKNYGDYSVLEFLPEQVRDEDGNLSQYNNYFGQLEFDGHLKLLRNTSGNTEHLATPVIYDYEKLQLWVKDVDSEFLSNDLTTYHFVYEGSKNQKLQWAEQFGLPWCRDFHPEIYERLLNETTVVEDNIDPFARGIIEFEDTPYVFENPDDLWEDGFVDTEETNDNYDDVFLFDRTSRSSENFSIALNYDTDNIPELSALIDWVGILPATQDSDDPYKSEWYPYGTDALGVFFMDKYLPFIKFRTPRSYEKSFNAPQKYIDGDGNNTTAYDALKSDINNPNYTTYYEYENEENEKKRDIVVLRENLVEPFAQRYEELLNE